MSKGWAIERERSRRVKGDIETRNRLEGRQRWFERKKEKVREKKNQRKNKWKAKNKERNLLQLCFFHPCCQIRMGVWECVGKQECWSGSVWRRARRVCVHLWMWKSERVRVCVSVRVFVCVCACVSVFCSFRSLWWNEQYNLGDRDPGSKKFQNRFVQKNPITFFKVAPFSIIFVKKSCLWLFSTFMVTSETFNRSFLWNTATPGRLPKWSQSSGLSNLRRCVYKPYILLLISQMPKLVSGS